MNNVDEIRRFKNRIACRKSRMKRGKEYKQLQTTVKRLQLQRDGLVQNVKRNKLKLDAILQTKEHVNARHDTVDGILKSIQREEYSNLNCHQDCTFMNNAGVLEDSFSKIASVLNGIGNKRNTVSVQYLDKLPSQTICRLTWRSSEDTLLHYVLRLTFTDDHLLLFLNLEKL